MSKILTIGNKDYQLEYTIEASLYSDCTQKATSLVFQTMEASANQNLTEMISTMTNIPETTLELFYAGLLEHHGDEIQSVDDAKGLVRTLFRENKDGEGVTNFYDLLSLIMEQMEEDGFFGQIGLTQMLSQMTEEEKPVKTPQDRKRKSTSKK